MMKGYTDDEMGGSAELLGSVEGQSQSASGPGVQVGENGATADKGYGCIAKFPLAGGFWQRPPRGGEA